MSISSRTCASARLNKYVLFHLLSLVAGSTAVLVMKCLSHQVTVTQAVTVTGRGRRCTCCVGCPLLSSVLVSSPLLSSLLSRAHVSINMCSLSVSLPICRLYCLLSRDLPYCSLVCATLLSRVLCYYLLRCLLLLSVVMCRLLLPPVVFVDMCHIPVCCILLCCCLSVGLCCFLVLCVALFVSVVVYLVLLSLVMCCLSLSAV